ncbi:MAG TPA: helix-turn-helix domain-containing protein [Flavobacteriaceae bacterium]
MKHLTIIVPRGQNNLSSIVGPFKIFNRANEFYEKSGHDPVFKIVLAGTTEKIDFYNGLFTVNPQKDILAISQTDLILIPSLNHNYELAIAENKEIIEWILKQYKAGAEIASICTGAFLLASAGILNGKRCSTHWAAADQFRIMFPEVNLQIDQLITDEHGIYTNGGAYSFLNLIIYLIEKYYNRETAIFCSKVFQIEIERNVQSPFAIFTGQKQHEDDMIKEAQAFMEHNLEDKLFVEDLSTKFSVSRRTFDRRFIKATGNTPSEYSQRLKIEAAKKSLENTRKTVNEVMYDVGYNDPKAFRNVFGRITGISPLDYRAKYNKGH